MLSSLTVEAIYDVAGEESLPRGRLWRALFPLLPILDSTHWVRRVDLCLIGGDPLTLSLRLSRAAQEAREGRIKTIGVVSPGDFSGAPLLAIDDPEVRKQLAETGGIPCGAPTPSTPPSGAGLELLEATARTAVQDLRESGIEGVFAVDHVQGGRPRGGDELVVRLSRKQGRPREGGKQRRPVSGIHGGQLRASPGGAGWLFDASARRSAQVERILHDGLREVFEMPPRGRRFVDVLVARRCEVLSGFISPPHADEAGPGVKFMEEELGVEVYDLSRRAPTSVSEAIEMWSRDLSRAAGDRSEQVRRKR